MTTDFAASSLPFAAVPSTPITVSFEFSPPKTDKAKETLWQSIDRLAPLSPAFMSVTYGAGGSTRERTHDTVVHIQKEKRIKAAAHLTCVGATRAEIDAIGRRYWDAGIRHVVALRGDPPAGESKYTPHPGGYAYGADLVAGLKRVADFEISVAGYPDVHPEAASATADIDNLKRKIDAGASRVITNLFLDTDVFRRFRDQAVAAGVNVPIVPGLMPIFNFTSITKFAQKNGVSMPRGLVELFAGLEQDTETHALIAATVAAEQVQTLTKDGETTFHFFTMNRADLTYAICHLLGLRPKNPAGHGQG